MSYNPLTDFLGVVRRLPSGAVDCSMPGLDFVIDALARSGMITLSVGQTAPIVNQPTTAWLKPAEPSWTAEGMVYLWNVLTGEYEPATPALWTALLTISLTGYVFQSVTKASDAVAALTSMVAVQRTSPGATTLRLPTVISRAGKALQIVDWSSGVANHTLTLEPAGSNTIMRLPSWSLLSTPDQLAGITLYPSPDLNGWVIAP